MNHNTLTKLILIVLTSYIIYHMTRHKSAQTHDNTLQVGTNAEYRPFSYIDNGRVVGFDIDLIKEIAKRLGKNIEVHDMPFTTLIPDMQFGNLHIIAAGMSPTPERAQQVNFTKPYILGDPLIAITLKGTSTVTNIPELHDKEIIVNQGFTADLQLSTLPGLNIRRLDTVADAFLALQNGRGDVFISARCSVEPYFKQHSREQFSITELPQLASDNYALAVSNKYPELLEQIQKALDEMEQDGSLNDLKQIWNVDGLCNP